MTAFTLANFTTLGGMRVIAVPTRSAIAAYLRGCLACDEHNPMLHGARSCSQCPVCSGHVVSGGSCVCGTVTP